MEDRARLIAFALWGAIGIWIVLGFGFLAYLVTVAR